MATINEQILGSIQMGQMAEEQLLENMGWTPLSDEQAAWLATWLAGEGLTTWRDALSEMRKVLVAAYQRGSSDAAPAAEAYKALEARFGSVSPQIFEKDILTAGNVSVNVSRQQVTIDGTDLQISPSLYRLLVAFIEAGGMTMTPGAISSATARDGDAGMKKDNHAQVMVMALRKKLVEAESTLLITTVRGYGYRTTVVK